MSSIPPIDVEHKVTPAGFKNAGRLFHWNELYAFWFEYKWDQKVLVIQTRLPFPGQVRAVLKDVDEDQIKKTIGKYLLFSEEPQKSWVDSATDWLSRKIPLDTTS